MPQGSGFSAHQAVQQCEVCHGLGEILRSKWGSGGPNVVQLGVCPSCGGKGSASHQHCSRCRGEGRAKVARTVKIRVPAGVKHDQVLGVRGQGNAGKFGGEPGKLFVKVQVYDLKHVKREGDHLYSDLTVELFDVLLGTAVEVDTVRGKRMLQIPAGR